MKGQLKQVFFLSIFGFLCTAFVFFVPRGSSSTEDEGGQAWWVVSQEEKSEFSWDVLPPVANLFTWTLTIAVGKFADYPIWKAFADSFSKKYGWKVRFLTGDVVSGADLLLLAYDDFTGLAHQSLRFQEDLKPFFIPQLRGFLDEQPDFLPVAVDPAVMVWLSWLEEGLDGLEYYFSQWTPKTVLSSFSFGLFNDPNLKDQNLLLAQQLEDFIKFNDVGAFSQWLEMNVLSPDQQKRLWELAAWSSQVDHLLLLRKIIGIEFMFHSSVPFYPKDPNSQGKIVSYLFPYQYVGLPVRLYGFVIPKATKNRAMVDQWLLEYMSTASEKGAQFLISRMFPVFRDQFDKLCGDTACGLPSDFFILKDGNAKIQRFLEDKLLKKVMEKKIQPDLYLREASV